MTALLVAFLAAFRASVRSRLEVEVEILALRHQLAVLQRQAPKRPHLGRTDRLLWVLLSRIWPNWRRAVQIVTPDTVVRWHRRGFALYWRWRSRPRRPGRPAVAVDIRALTRQMQAANPLWGAPRMHGEWLKVASAVSQATVATYLVRRRRPPSQPWRTFLANHGSEIVAADCFVVPTALCRVVFVLVVFAHHRRRVVHVAVTAHPTAGWTTQQLREACPLDAAPR
jgi:putative transposase